MYQRYATSPEQLPGMGTAETREREPSLDQVLDLAPQVVSVAARLSAALGART